MSDRNNSINKILNKEIQLSPIIILTIGLFILLMILLFVAFTSKKGSEEAKPDIVETEQRTETEKKPAGADPSVIRIEDESDPGPSVVNEAEPAAVEEAEAEADEEEPVNTEYEEQAERILAGMTLEEKIYQMMILMPEQLTGSEAVTAADEIVEESLKKYPVGGIMYMSGNLKGPEQTRTMLRSTQEYAYNIEGIPLFLCVDEEGGRVARIGENAAFGVEKIPPMAEIKNEEDAYKAGSTIGEYLYGLGFNVDFAPDCDVLTNKDNTIIGDRSFGSDADKVSKYAKAYSDGLHDKRILSTYKHFPGHGATAGDTHEGFAYTDKTLDELAKDELIPFADAAAAGADMVMVSHIWVPMILKDNTPCSLSYHMITEVLKGELGYDGIVVTDALNMGAITDNYGRTEAALMAIKAGNDMILTPGDFASIPDEVAREIEKGNISEARIDESVKKIIIKKLGTVH